MTGSVGRPDSAESPDIKKEYIFMEKVLSFVIPAYNSQNFLDKCIPSLTCTDVLDELDIIIVNDGSTDDTAAVAHKYCARYPDSVRLICQENRGHGGALNSGCMAARGKYLKALDADDWVLTENLPAFVAFLRSCDSDVVLTNYHMQNITTGETTAWRCYAEPGRSYMLGEVMDDWKSFDRVLTYHGITYRTDFYRNRGIQLSQNVFYEDYEFSTIPCCYAQSMTPLDLFLYQYRVGDVQQSISDANQVRRVGHTKTVLERLLKEYSQLALPEEDAGRAYYQTKTQGLLLRYCITNLLLDGDRKHGRKMTRQMVERFRQELPPVYRRSRKQLALLYILNFLHLSKDFLERLQSSRLYNALRHNHDFS